MEPMKELTVETLKEFGRKCKVNRKEFMEETGTGIEHKFV